MLAHGRAANAAPLCLEAFELACGRTGESVPSNSCNVPSSFDPKMATAKGPLIENSEKKRLVFNAGEIFYCVSLLIILNNSSGVYVSPQ